MSARVVEVTQYAIVQALRQHHTECAHAANIRGIYDARASLAAALDTLEKTTLARLDRTVARIVTRGSR